MKFSDIVVDNGELKITGMSVNSKYGVIRPIKVYEYDKFLRYVQFLKKKPLAVKLMFINMKAMQTDNFKVVATFKRDVSKEPMVNLIHKNVFDIQDFIKEMLGFIFTETVDNVIYKISKSDDAWNKFRNFILDFNGIYVEEESTNPEIQRFNEMSRAIKEAKGAIVTFESIYSSILTFTGMNPDVINNLTLYQFYSTFKRISAFKDYDTGVLFKTVDSKGKIKVEPWSKVIENKYEKEEFVHLDRLEAHKEDL